MKKKKKKKKKTNTPPADIKVLGTVRLTAWMQPC
jgi:hypothetical protein